MSIFRKVIMAGLLACIAVSAQAIERQDLSFNGDLIDVLPQLRKLDPQMTITRTGVERDVPITVSILNGAKLDILRTIGEQAGDKADLIYSPKTNQLKIEYKPVPAVQQVNSSAAKTQAFNPANTQAAAPPVRRHPDGSVEVVFGRAKPELLCQPNEVCGVELEPGETIRGVELGDPTRWEITPSTVGDDENRTIVLVLRPTLPNLKTRLMVSTNRRLYSIFLASNDGASDTADTRLYFQYPVRN